MNPLKSVSILTFALLFFITVLAVPAQTEPKASLAGPSYEAALHVLLGSDQTKGGDILPPALAPIARQVRSDFGPISLKVVETHLGRLSNNGALENKGVSSGYKPGVDVGAPIFLDWRLVNLMSAQNAAGQNVYQFQSFRFGARVPVRVGEGPGAPITYESIGLTLDRFNVRDGVPTLVGTLTQPKTDGTLFLVLTVKGVEK